MKATWQLQEAKNRFSEVVTLAMSLPTAVKTRNGELKHVLKAAVRNLLPEAILKRPKQGFGVPVREWFFDRLGAETRTRLDRFCRETDFFDRAESSLAKHCVAELGKGHDVARRGPGGERRRGPRRRAGICEPRIGASAFCGNDVSRPYSGGSCPV